jgi:hypothetical protein
MQHWGFSGGVLRLMAIVGGLGGALMVLGCSGGDGGTSTEIATHDAAIPIDSRTVQALEGQTFMLSSGATISPELADQPMSLTFTNTAEATPTATVTVPDVQGTDGNPAQFTSTVTFGSCTFTVTASNFPSRGPQRGDKFTINPCHYDVATHGIRTNHGTLVNILVRLGLIPSASQQAAVMIAYDGEVTVNGVDTGYIVILETGGQGQGS